MKRFIAVMVGSWMAVMTLGSVAGWGAETLTLMLDWFPNVDHVPIYVARERGYFSEEGLEVEILSPSDTADSLKLAAAGKVDVAVSYQPQMTIAAAEGVGLKVVGRLVGHPLTTLLFLKSSGVRAPADLSGKTIGYTVPGLMDVLLAAFADVNGIESYTPVNVGFAIAASLTSGKVDAVMGPFKTYETVTLSQMGLDAGFFELEQWGIPPYDELIFVCGKEAASQRSSAMVRFREAVARGIERTRLQPESAFEDYLKSVPDVDKDTETKAFVLTRPYFADHQRFDPKRWEAFANFALATGLIQTPVDVRSLPIPEP
jgi:putative hydroxymethylpyrimidine transport system substrate-binding protein